MFGNFVITLIAEILLKVALKHQKSNHRFTQGAK